MEVEPAISPASRVPGIRGAVVPQSAAGVPSPGTVSPSHVCAAEVDGAAGENSTSKTPVGVVGGGWTGPGGAPQTKPWPGGRMTQLASSANPPLLPVAFNSLS